METYDLLHVAGREWRTLCHSADFAAKEKSLLGGTGPSSGIRCVPKGEVNAPGKHSNSAVRGQLQVYKQWPGGQVHFPKTRGSQPENRGRLGCMLRTYMEPKATHFRFTWAHTRPLVI